MLFRFNIIIQIQLLVAQISARRSKEAELKQALNPTANCYSILAGQVICATNNSKFIILIQCVLEESSVLTKLVFFSV